MATLLDALDKHFRQHQDIHDTWILRRHAAAPCSRNNSSCSTIRPPKAARRSDPTENMSDELLTQIASFLEPVQMESWFAVNQRLRALGRSDNQTVQVAKLQSIFGYFGMLDFVLQHIIIVTVGPDAWDEFIEFFWNLAYKLQRIYGPFQVHPVHRTALAESILIHLAGGETGNVWFTGDFNVLSYWEFEIAESAYADFPCFPSSTATTPRTLSVPVCDRGLGVLVGDETNPRRGFDHEGLRAEIMTRQNWVDEAPGRRLLVDKGSAGYPFVWVLQDSSSEPYYFAMGFAKSEDQDAGDTRYRWQLLHTDDPPFITECEEGIDNVFGQHWKSLAHFMCLYDELELYTVAMRATWLMAHGFLPILQNVDWEQVFTEAAPSYRELSSDDIARQELLKRLVEQSTAGPLPIAQANRIDFTRPAANVTVNAE